MTPVSTLGILAMSLVSAGDLTPGSELDELFMAGNTTHLFIGLSGNLETNGHAFVIFINAPGFVGQTELRGEGVSGPPFNVQAASRQVVVDSKGTPDPADDTWSYGASGTMMPCEVDYAIAVDVDGGTMSVSEYRFFNPAGPPVGTMDPTPANPADPLLNLYTTHNFVGQSPINDHNDDFETQGDPDFTQGGFNNTNTDGVTDTDGSQAESAETGFEIGIPLDKIGFGLSGTETIDIFVALIDGADNPGVIVNQVLPPITGDPGCNPPAALGLRPNLATFASCRSVDLKPIWAWHGVCEGLVDIADYAWISQETQTCPTPYGDQQPAGIPGTVTSARSRKNCNLSILPALGATGRTSESRRYLNNATRTVDQVVIDYSGDPAFAVVDLDEDASCGGAPVYVDYTGTSSISVIPGTGSLTVNFTPGLETGRAYRLRVPHGAGTTDLFFRGLTGDVNHDGLVNATDRSFVVASWTGAYLCAADLDQSNSVNATDRSLAVGQWTNPTQNCAP